MIEPFPNYRAFIMALFFYLNIPLLRTPFSPILNTIQKIIIYNSAFLQQHIDAKKVVYRITGMLPFRLFKKFNANFNNYFSY
ncbi:MAG: hypothetical protein PWP07_2689 [Epulopiscium sp.]|nr:hypothetical protein [Candidatus Epulonipiscium sp.]